MKLLYYQNNNGGNFGDNLNLMIWPKLLSLPASQCFDQDTRFIGIGTLLNHRLDRVSGKKIIFGSGFGYGDPPDLSNAKTYFVRGPLSADALGLRPYVTDPAILLKKIVPGCPAEHKYGFGIMPHHKTDISAITKRYSKTDFHIINPSNDASSIVSEIRQCGLLITESLHGAICADTFRQPWIPFSLSSSFFAFKWHDWAGSMDMEIDINDISTPDDIEKLATAEPMLSGERIFNQRHAQVEKQLRLLNKDIASKGV